MSQSFGLFGDIARIAEANEKIAIQEELIVAELKVLNANKEKSIEVIKDATKAIEETSNNLKDIFTILKELLTMLKPKVVGINLKINEPTEH